MPSKLEQLQLQFRQKLMQEKEERMIKIHTDNQQKALSKVTRYDSSPPITVPATMSNTIIRKPPSMSTSPLRQSPTEKGSPGVDRSRPLPPISRNHQQATRSNNSSAPSESSMRAPVQNCGRARSIDSEVPNGGMVKMNGRSAQPPDLYRSPYTQSRRSPEVDTWTQKPSQKSSHVNSKPNYDAVPKVSNGHLAQAYCKSSIAEQRTMTGSSSKPQPTTAAVRGKPKTTVVNMPRKSPNVAPNPKNTSTAAPIRKPPNPNQDQCRYCGRNFNKDRIEKHVSICSKASSKKVKVFDVTKMRVKGTEAESFLRKGGVAPSDPPKPKKSNWKKQHEEFINAIREAKMAQRHLAAGGKLSDLPPPPPSDTSDYVPCPYCGRKFNEGVAQRHIPKCKNILSNKKTPMKKK